MKSGQSTLYQTFYKTKLTLIAVIVVVFGVALLFFESWARQQGGWSWVAAVPVGEIGSALFGAGLIAIAFEYISREHGEAEAMRRLRTVLAEQAPAMRDAVIQGFAFNADDLSRVSSPETLDQVARNTLAIQLKDEELAHDVYSDLSKQVLRAPERWYDVDVSVSLDPWTEGLASGRGSMFVATVRWEYRVIPSQTVMRFSAVSDMDDYRALLEDPSTTGMWYFQPINGLTAASPEAFELVQLTVNGAERRIRRSARKSAQTYTVDTGVTPGGTEEVKLAYTYRVLIQRNSHLLALDFPRPAKGVKVSFSYGGSGIRYVHSLDLIASAQKALITKSPASVPQPSIELGFDGWIFPRSGVVFVWVLKDEMNVKPLEEVAS